MEVLAYASDVVFIDISHNSLKSSFSRLENVAKNVGPQVNEDQSEFKVTGRRDGVEIFLSLNSESKYEFISVKKFSYLSSIKTYRLRLTEKSVILNTETEYAYMDSRRYHRNRGHGQ